MQLNGIGCVAFKASKMTLGKTTTLSGNSALVTTDNAQISLKNYCWNVFLIWLCIASLVNPGSNVPLSSTNLNKRLLAFVYFFVFITENEK